MSGTRAVGAICILLLLACRGADGRGDVPQTAAVPAESFLRYGMVELGPAREQFRTRFGEPDSARAAGVPNVHDPALTDTVFTLFYPGLEAEVYRASFDGRELLAGLRIDDARYLRPDSPLQLDITSEDVTLLLGTPDDTVMGDLVYRCTGCTVGGQDVLRLRVERDTLRSIGVQYWLD